MQSMDETLTHVVQQFVKERETIGANTQKEVEEVKNIVREMATRLAKKTAEMRHVRRLAQHILDQRTEMEEFFMDSLEFVRGELGKERRTELKNTQDRYKQSMRDVVLYHLIVVVQEQNINTAFKATASDSKQSCIRYAECSACRRKTNR